MCVTDWVQDRKRKPIRGHHNKVGLNETGSTMAWSGLVVIIVI